MLYAFSFCNSCKTQTLRGSLTKQTIPLLPGLLCFNLSFVKVVSLLLSLCYSKDIRTMTLNYSQHVSTHIRRSFTHLHIKVCGLPFRTVHMIETTDRCMSDGRSFLLPPFNLETKRWTDTSEVYFRRHQSDSDKSPYLSLSRQGGRSHAVP